MSAPTRQPGAGLFGGDLYTFDTLPSTNRRILDHADELRHGDTIRAVSQTHGRGRFERSWFSPRARGLAMSILLDPDQMPDVRLDLLGACTALAIVDALATLGISAQVKWPNDVLAQNRKISGILIERASVSAPVVLGVGVNVNMQPEHWQGVELRTPATSVMEQTGREHDAGEILSTLLRCLEPRLATSAEADGPRAVVQYWSEHDALAGTAIDVDSPSGTLRGRYMGISEDGRLLLTTEDGARHTIHAGDVSVYTPAR